MIEVHQWLSECTVDAKMIMQVHDELVFEVADADCDTLCDTVPRIMSEVISLDVPLVADVGAGLNWDEAH